MTQFSFTQATKSQSKLRLAIFGPAGAGKTYTSLAMATGMGGKIAVIDTEYGSASKYADRFEFDTLILREPSVQNMVQAVASASDYNVLIIDSLSHAWRELLTQVDKLAKAKYRGNTWAAWSEGTPLQNDMVFALLSFPGHIIATMRTQTEWVTTESAAGKVAPMRVGLAPVQGKGIEYEFDMLMEINPDHLGTVIKDRTGKYQDKIIELPGEQLGKELVGWLAEGKVAPKTKDDLIEYSRVLGLTPRDIAQALKASNLEFDPNNWDLMIRTVTAYANGGERVES